MRRLSSKRLSHALAAVLTIAALAAGQEAWAQSQSFPTASGGSGTQDDPYLIKTADDLRALASDVNGSAIDTNDGNAYADKYFRLDNDIDFQPATAWNDDTSTERNLDRIGGQELDVNGGPSSQVYDAYEKYFSGHFDGGGHTISGLRIYQKGNTQYALFGDLRGSVKNLKIANARISSNVSVGAIVGINKGTVENCEVGSNVTVYGTLTINDANAASTVGGVVGFNYGTVTGCSCSARVISASSDGKYFGGIAGKNAAGSTIENCTAKGVAINSVSFGGAIVGKNYNGSTLSGNTYYTCVVGSNAFNIGVGQYMTSNTAYDLQGDKTSAAIDDTNKKELWLFEDRDNQALITAYKNGASGAGISSLDVTLKGRTLYRASHQWNTLCLPFKVNMNALSSAYQGLRYLSSATYNSETGALSVGFETAQSHSAKRPFLIRWTDTSTTTYSDSFEPRFTNIAISDFSGDAPSNDYANFYTASTPYRRVYLYGTYAPVSETDGKLFDQYNTAHGAHHAYMTIADPPARTGYTFIGWNTAPDGTGTPVTTLMPVTEGTDPSFTIYAQWRKNAVTITDGEGISTDLSALAGKVADVTLKRGFTQGARATLCLPFTVPAAQKNALGTFYRFGGLKEGTTDVVQMVEVAAEADLAANTAYIFLPGSTVAAATGLAFSDVSIAATMTPVDESGETFAFIGTYEAMRWSDGTQAPDGNTYAEENAGDIGKVYGFALNYGGFTEGSFVRLGNGASAAPFRAYLKYNGDLSNAQLARTRGAAAELPATLSIEWVKAGGTATGIRPPLTPPTQEGNGGAWYLLDGRRLPGKPRAKGIYIHNGRKEVIR